MKEIFLTESDGSRRNWVEFVRDVLQAGKSKMHLSHIETHRHILKPILKVTSDSSLYNGYYLLLWQMDTSLENERCTSLCTTDTYSLSIQRTSLPFNGHNEKLSIQLKYLNITNTSLYSERIPMQHLSIQRILLCTKTLCKKKTCARDEHISMQRTHLFTSDIIHPQGTNWHTGHANLTKCTC